LVLFSRWLNRITTPTLYRTFVQTKYKVLPSFLRILSEKPRIGLLVKKILVYEVDKEDMDMGGFSREDLERMGLGLNILEFFETEKPDWVDDPEGGN
jgi:hypothetical protein